MTAQRTLLDGDTGQKFDSLELLVGAAASAVAAPPLRSVRLTFNAPTGLAYVDTVWLDANVATGLADQVGTAFGALNAGAFEFSETGLYLVQFEAATGGGITPATYQAALTCGGQSGNPPFGGTPAPGIFGTQPGGIQAGGGPNFMIDCVGVLVLASQPQTLSLWSKVTGSGGGPLAWARAKIVKLG